MSIKNIISELDTERKTILKIINNIKTVLYEKRIPRLAEILREPVYLFIEVVLVTAISIITMPFLYNFIFAVPPSPITVTIYLILVVFIIIIPFNLLVNKLSVYFKQKLLKKSDLEIKLAELTKYEKSFLSMLFPNLKVENKPKKINILSEIEIDESALNTSLFYNDFEFKNTNLEFKLSVINFHKNISGKYLVYDECLNHEYGKVDFIIENNIIWKNISGGDNMTIRFLPKHRGLTKLLYMFNTLSSIKKTELSIEHNRLKITVYEPVPPGVEWLSAKIPETIDSFKNFILAFIINQSTLL
ncbi:MAG: hypothetical protein QW739_04155 [Candidatus Odinarchaeota archaeon]